MSAGRVAGMFIACSLLVIGCARSPRQVAWDASWSRLLDADPADPATAERWAMLAETAPREVDAATAELARAAALEASGDVVGAASAWGHLGEDAPQRPTRARAHYEVARLAERTGRLVAAVGIYRRLVLTYPDLMPGERSLTHLERIFEARGARGVTAHLRWTWSIYPRLRHTSLGDNLVFYPARLAHRRYLETNDAAAAALAERLYVQIDRDHPGSGLWNDAWWQRSLLYHRQGRFADEIGAIRRIQRTFEQISLFGHDQHVYFSRGQLRIARTQRVELADPRAAAESLARYVATYTDSLRRDDAIYWRACALYAAGDAATAEAALAGLERDYPESKYLAWTDRARSEPDNPRCIPPDLAAAEPPP